MRDLGIPPGTGNIGKDDEFGQAQRTHLLGGVLDDALTESLKGSTVCPPAF